MLPGVGHGQRLMAVGVSITSFVGPPWKNSDELWGPQRYGWARVRRYGLREHFHFLLPYLSLSLLIHICLSLTMPFTQKCLAYTPRPGVHIALGQIAISWSNRVHFSTSPHIYSNKSITIPPVSIRTHLTFGYYKACSLQTLLIFSISKCNSWVAQ